MRVWERYGKIWLEPYLYTHDGNKLKNITGHRYGDAPKAIRITAPNTYYSYLLSLQGGDANSYGCFMLQGYHPGGYRNRATKLSGSEIVSVTVDEMDFIASGWSSTYLSWSLVPLIGPEPSIII